MNYIKWRNYAWTIFVSYMLISNAIGILLYNSPLAILIDYLSLCVGTFSIFMVTFMNIVKHKDRTYLKFKNYCYNSLLLPAISLGLLNLSFSYHNYKTISLCIMLIPSFLLGTVLFIEKYKNC